MDGRKEARKEARKDGGKEGMKEGRRYTVMHVGVYPEYYRYAHYFTMGQTLKKQCGIKFKGMCAVLYCIVLFFYCI